MAQLRTFLCWFKDESAMAVTAASVGEAKAIAQARSRENLKDAYFESDNERKNASRVIKVEE